VATSKDCVNAVLMRLLPADYGDDVKIKTAADMHPEKYIAVDSLDTALEMVNAAIARKDGVLMRSYIEDAHPLLADALLLTMGYRYTWIAPLEPTALVVLSETKFASLSYQDAMRFLLSDYVCKKHQVRFINRRMKDDPLFEKAFLKDPQYARVLMLANPQVALQFQEINETTLPLEASTYLRLDICQTLGIVDTELTKEHEDIVNIHLLLSNQMLMLKQLDKLESALNEYIKQKRDDTHWDGLPLRPPPRDNFRLFKKPYVKDEHNPFLFGFFSNWAMSHGFSNVTRLTSVTSHDDFMQNLKDKWLFKDPAFGGEFHGAWTHLLQWYCIGSAVEHGDIMMSSSPAHIYQYIGEHGGAENLLWGRTFEVATSLLLRSNDYRNVDELNAFINKDETFIARCPTLHALILYRTLHDKEKTIQITESSGDRP